MLKVIGVIHAIWGTMTMTMRSTGRTTGRKTGFVLAAIGATVVAGCADGTTGLLSTSSIGSPATATAAAKVDPACVALTARIDALRKEGFVERVEKASVGKSASVTVKRESLAKMTELDKANAEFQAKCAAPAGQGATTAAAAATPGPAAAATPVAAAAAAKPIAAAAAKPGAAVAAAAAR